MRESVPLKEPISLAQWQKFIDNEIEDRQLVSRQSGRENRAKKTDVHYSDRTSYAEVEHMMMVRFNFSITTEIYYSSLFYFAGLILILLFFMLFQGVGSGPGGKPHRLDTYVDLRTKKGKDKEVSPSVAATIVSNPTV